MENNNGKNFNVGGVLLGLGAVALATYTYVKKVKAEKAKQVIEIQPEAPQEQPIAVEE